MPHPKHLAFILLCLCLTFGACHDCSEYRDEQYTEVDTLTLLHPLLRKMKETYAEIGELDIPVPNDQVYRMYYNHAFGECAYVIRLSKLANACAIHCTYIDWIPLDSTWKTIHVEWTDKNMPTSRWTEFENLMTQAHFWTTKQDIHRHGLDGYSIILEGYRPQAAACNKRDYHLIFRWSHEELALRQAVDLLLQYAEVEDLPGGR
jgi:hypothetical protein